jgi:hypothetical protein
MRARRWGICNIERHLLFTPTRCSRIHVKFMGLLSVHGIITYRFSTLTHYKLGKYSNFRDFDDEKEIKASTVLENTSMYFISIIFFSNKPANGAYNAIGYGMCYTMIRHGQEIAIR